MSFPSCNRTVQTYNTVIQTFANAMEPLKAEQTLRELIGRERGGISNAIDAVKLVPESAAADLWPDSESYAYVIRAWAATAKKGSFQALESAIEWMNVLIDLEKQQQEQFVSDTVSSRRKGPVTNVDLYMKIIEACRECAQPYPEALDLAVDMFDKWRQSYHPLRSLGYTRLLQAGLRALSLPENDVVRTEFCKELIANAAEDGLVSKILIKALANEPTYRDGWTVEESAILTHVLIRDKWPLPNSWTRNVEEKMMPQGSDCIRTIRDIVPRYPQIRKEG